MLDSHHHICPQPSFLTFECLDSSIYWLDCYSFTLRPSNVLDRYLYLPIGHSSSTPTFFNCFPWIVPNIHPHIQVWIHWIDSSSILHSMTVLFISCTCQCIGYCLWLVWRIATHGIDWPYYNDNNCFIIRK